MFSILRGSEADFGRDCRADDCNWAQAGRGASTDCYGIDVNFKAGNIRTCRESLNMTERCSWKMLEDATPGTHVLWAVSYWQASATQASVAKEEEAASQQAQELRVQSAVLSQEFSRVFKRSQTGFIPSAILYISLYAFTSFLSTNRSISWWTNAFNFSSLAEMHQLHSWERQKRLAPWRKNAKLTWTRHHRGCRG